MRATAFVGRVGGLAMALGVGSAVFAGQGAAWADAGSSPARGADSGSPAGAPSGAKSVAGPSAPARGHRAGNNSSPSASPKFTAPSRSRVQLPEPSSDAPASAVAAVSPVATVSAVGSVSSVASVSPVRSAGPAAAAGPLTPVDSPLAWGPLALARREPLSASAVDSAFPGTNNVGLLGLSDAVNAVSQTRAVQSETIKGITVLSLVGNSDGIVLGQIQATTQRANTTVAITPLSGSNGGKIRFTNIASVFTMLPYATWLDPNGTKGTEQARFLIRETTAFDRTLFSIPLLGSPARAVVEFLQNVPLIKDLLAPIIGVAVVANTNVNVAELAPGATPVGFTYKVTSFDGVKISTNYFPAAGLSAVATAPTAVIAPGFGFAGVTDPNAVFALKDEVPGIGTLRKAGYDVVTYDPRGRFDSGGQVHMASPAYEGKDVSALVSWIASSTPASLNAPNDPKVGLLGGSYGAALQFAAANDPRIDAMVPVDGWDTLLGSFYPQKSFRTAYGALTILSLITTGSRVYPPLYWAFGSGMLFNWLGPWSRSLINDTNPQLDQLTAPTLMIRGYSDVLFPLEQGTASAEQILASGKAPLKMLWFCGGHGRADTCGNEQATAMNASTLAWLAQYVAGAGTPANNIPNFSWFDQKGDFYSSNLMSFQDGFNNLPAVVATNKGGVLGIVPYFGGSGTITTLVNATVAGNAINVAVPTDKLVAGTQVVGAPTVSFTYRGLGTGKALFAQVVDKKTGQVLGSVVAPVPVTLDGRTHTVSVDIAEISYTVGAGDSLEVQITSSATAFENASVGVINISDITVSLPNRTATSN